MTPSVEIRDFVLARLDEDERAARVGELGFGPRGLCMLYGLRAIVDDHVEDEGCCSRCWDGDDTAGVDGIRCSLRMWPCPTILAVAAIWSEHPDYHVRW